MHLVLCCFAVCQLPNGLERKDLGTDAGRRPLKAGLSSRISWRRAKAGRERERDLPQVLYSPWDSTLGNFILNLGKLKRKTVFSLRTLYQDQANNNSESLGLQEGFSHDAFPLLPAHRPDFTEGIGVDNLYGFLLERFHSEEVSGKS